MLLNVHSCYSLRYGVLQAKEILRLARDQGYNCIALTDINNTSGCLNFIRQAPQYGIRPVVGIDFRNGIDQLFIALAKNNDGFEEINAFLSAHLTQSAGALPEEAPPFRNSFVVYPFQKAPKRKLRAHEFIGIHARDLNRIKFNSILHPSKMLVLQPASFRHTMDHCTHRLLRAIDKNTIYTRMTASDYASGEDLFLRKESLSALFSDHPHIIRNTEKLLAQCSIEFGFNDGIPKNQKSYTGSHPKDIKLIRRLCKDNLSYRYPEPTDEIVSRIEKELSIIEEKGFVSYFLINWDITSYARSRGYFYVGRGSGANSIVAYLLQITDVDPIELDLYFERFINLYRENPPDFDIDFSWKDREDVTQYIFDRFPNTALLATYNTFQYRAAVRELGKVFGLPKEEIDKLSSGRPVYEQLDQLSQLVLKYSQLIQGLPNHLSVHAGGIVISELPMHRYTATFVPPKGFPTTQFDMVIAEDIGLYKFDILGQRGLAKIKEGLSIVRYNNPNHDIIDIHDIKKFKNDPGIKEHLQEGEAIGCFYVESPAMRMLLKKLKVDSYLGLVAASSIIRPGVAKSGMMREYILRERQPERRKDAHPILLEIMPDTYGIMVYQEDVIKVAHYFAGLTLGEADVLRRGMSGKYRSREEFERVKDKFFLNCQDKGYTPSLAEDVWRQIESFAGYAFAKGHSASYAVESYQSLYLKTHYPLEYMVATINNGGGFYRPELYVHEARMKGAAIIAPDVNKSNYGCTISGKNIYLGLGFVKGLEANAIHLLVEERNRGGCYKNLTDFVERTGTGLESLCSLIRVNAFSFCPEPKKALLWKAHQLLSRKDSPKLIQQRLFYPPVRDYKLPALSQDAFEDAFDQIELLGFPLCNPFDLLKEKLPSCRRAKDMPSFVNKTIRIPGYLIAVKDTGTVKGQRMNFGTFIDLDGHFIDTVHFPDASRNYPFRGRGVYLITGKVVEEFGFYSIEVQHMDKLAYMTDPRFNEETFILNPGRSSSRRKSLKAI